MTVREAGDASVTSGQGISDLDGPAGQPVSRKPWPPPIRHGACGKWWTGPTNGHCGACHETFSSGAFDRHQRIHQGVVTCSTDRLVAHPKPWGVLWRSPGNGHWPSKADE